MDAPAGPSPLSRATPALAVLLAVLTGVYWVGGGNRLQHPSEAVNVPTAPASQRERTGAAEALKALMDQPQVPGRPIPGGVRYDLGETAFGSSTTLTVREDGTRIVEVREPRVPTEALGTVEGRGQGTRQAVILDGPLRGARVEASPDTWTLTLPLPQ